MQLLANRRSVSVPDARLLDTQEVIGSIPIQTTMSDTEKTPEPTKGNVAGALGVILIIVLFISSVGTLGLYPWTTEGVVNRVTYGFNRSSFIVFDDGRTLNLRGQPTRSLIAGKYYKITYNNFGMYYDVEEIEK